MLSRKNRAVELKLAEPTDRELILFLFRSSPSYFLRVDGCLPTEAAVDDAIYSKPSRLRPDYRKEFLILSHEGREIGTAELHVQHPEAGIAYLGLLLIREDLLGQGLGVADDNDVSGFWSKMGYRPTGHSYNWLGQMKSNHVVEYEKWIGESPRVSKEASNHIGETR